MDRDIFGTDGIRGKAYEYPLNEAGARQVGKAVASYFSKYPGEYLLIGGDTRESTAMLEQAVSDGVTSMGIAARSLSVVPTAGLAYLTNTLGAKAGVMITASHNPYVDNGIKVFSPQGTKLSDDVEAELNKLIKSDLSVSQQPATSELATDLIQKYVDFLVSTAQDHDAKDFKLAIDCANGATSLIAKQIFSSLGYRAEMLSDQPDGKNINDHCGATDTRALQDYVTEHHCNAGIAFDGDGDRVMIIDERGRKLTGDHTLYILALSRHVPGVVATIMSNVGLEQALQKHNIALLRSAVGDRYVLAEMERSHYILGGEQSGHVIMMDYYPTGDGILTAIQCLDSVLRSGKTLAEWYDEIIISPQALVNIDLPSKTLLPDPKVEAYIREQTELIKGNGRLNIRPSGTEPLLRIMVEAADADGRAQAIADELRQIITSIKE